jgi:hypothetical protein
MRRSPPPRRKTPLRSKVRVRPVNRKRAAKRKAEQLGPQAALCHMLPCPACVPQVYRWRTVAEVVSLSFIDPSSGSQAHHEPPVGMDQEGKDEDTCPLCETHHTERHTIGIDSFERKYGLNLRGMPAMIRDARMEMAA